MERSADWIAQAKRDLASAQYQREGGFFEWATFAAQQSAEKGLKAVYQRHGGDAWGHSCASLLQGLIEELDLHNQEPGLLRQAQLLDRFYIPARYPNGWGAGAPKDLISEDDAQDAICCAQAILRFCEDLLARP